MVGRGLTAVAGLELFHRQCAALCSRQFGGAAVEGYPTLVVDREKVASIDAVTHRVNFRPEGEIGGSLQQGPIVNTPAVGDLAGDERPEIVVGTNEEYPEDLNSGATTPSGQLLQLLQDQIGLDTGNTRVYALKPEGDPGAPSAKILILGFAISAVNPPTRHRWH